MNDIITTPVEDLKTTSGRPMFDERTRAYLRAVRLADPAVLAPQSTVTCPECEEAVTGDGLVITSDGMAAHVVLHGSVVLGCEGYCVNSPAALGLDPGQWQDWRDSHPQAGWVTRDTGGTILRGPSLPCGCPLDADCTGYHSGAL